MIRKSIFILLLIICLLLIRNNHSEIIKGEYHDEYYGYLLIPSIDMKLGFYNFDDKRNNVNYNIELIDTKIEDTYLLAGHSGTGKVSFFNNLRYLKVGDDVYLQFDSIKYHYQVSNIKSIIKNGKLTIKKQKGWLILTTCDQINKGYQLVIETTKIE